MLTLNMLPLIPHLTSFSHLNVVPSTAYSNVRVTNLLIVAEHFFIEPLKTRKPFEMSSFDRKASWLQSSNDLFFIIVRFTNENDDNIKVFIVADNSCRLKSHPRAFNAMTSKRHHMTFSFAQSRKTFKWRQVARMSTRRDGDDVSKLPSFWEQRSEDTPFNVDPAVHLRLLYLSAPEVKWPSSQPNRQTS